MNEKNYWKKQFENRDIEDFETILKALFEVIEESNNWTKSTLNKLEFLQKRDKYLNKIRALVKK